jgi:hypothetical protein
MRRRCGGCGATWDAPARFCGHCGSVLSTVVPQPQARHRRGWQVAVTSLVTVVLVLAVLGVASLELRLPRIDRGDPAVSLPHAEEVPDGRALDPDERAAALAPFDPNRLTCAPAGCERWRRPIDHGWFGNVELDGDQVVVAFDGLVAIDRATGADRWQVPFAPELGWDLDADPGWGPDPPHVSAAEGVIAVASHAGVQLVDRDGGLRWARAFPEELFVETVLVVDDVVVLFQQQQRDPEPVVEGEVVDEPPPPWVLTVVDLADGQIRWQHEGHTQRGLVGKHGVAVTVDDEVHVLELASGEPRFTFPLGPEGWFWAVGDVVGVNDGPPRERLPDDDPAPLTSPRFLSALDGHPLGGFAELDVQFVQELDDLLVVFATTLDRDAALDPEAGIELLALEPAGAIRWQLDLGPAGFACCGSALDLGDGRLLVAAAPTTDRVVVDAATGRILERRGPWRPEADEETGFYQHGPSLLAEHRYGGTGASLRLYDVAGRVLEVRGQAWPLLPRDGTQEGDQPILLVSDRELVAIDFP